MMADKMEQAPWCRTRCDRCKKGPWFVRNQGLDSRGKITLRPHRKCCDPVKVA